MERIHYHLDLFPIGGRITVHQPKVQAGVLLPRGWVICASIAPGFDRVTGIARAALVAEKIYLILVLLKEMRG